ncbi:pregnancy-associated glycoprotein-like [Dasypus novemcinctus]|uniref:pregnancy-associated glycoprotein-like n=1 Tax=Dasypus novemcinctus TaxID=9361 RepID=UPI0026602C2E|nr:pregnancy-associated glycoprotein-like [Dasypus novemcinctus]
MRWFWVLGLVALSECLVTIPLKKAKSMRESLREKGMLRTFLEKHLCNLESASDDMHSDPGVPFESLGNNLALAYVGTIRIGTPPRELNVLFDTCLTYLWVPSVSCSSPVCFNNNTFDPGLSSTFLNTTKPVFSFDRGSKLGFVGYDVVQVGSLVIPSQAFGLTLHEVSSLDENEDSKEACSLLDYGDFDGVLGLAFPRLSYRGATPVFDQLWELGFLSENLFAFYLSSEDKKNSSVLMLGGVDPSYYSGELHWVPVSRPFYWEVVLDSVSIDGEVIACKHGCWAIFDTGTSLLHGPYDSVLNIHTVIGAELIDDKYILDCGTISSLPDITFTINGSHYPVPASAYVWQRSSGSCHSNFVGNVVLTNDTIWSLGNVFLQLYFSVYDRGNNRIGLAPAA